MDPKAVDLDREATNNATDAVTLSSLPVEVAIEIFHQFCSTNIIIPPDMDLKSLVKMLREVHPEALATGASAHWHRSLAILVRVCKWWKILVDNTPRLWAFVFSGDPPKVVQKALLKSEDYPLLCEGAWGSNADTAPLLPSFLSLVQPHFHRSTVIALRINPFDYSRFLETPTPSLRTLVLICHPEDQDTRRLDLLGCSSGSLTRLTLRGVDVVWDAPIVSGLQQLTLERVDATMAQVLVILSNCSDLQELSLSTLQGPRSPYSGGTADLPNLLRLECYEADRDDLILLITSIFAPSCYIFGASTRRLPDLINQQGGATDSVTANLRSILLQAFPAVLSNTNHVELCFDESFDFKAMFKDERGKSQWHFSLVLLESPQMDTVRWLWEQCGQPTMALVMEKLVPPMLLMSSVLLELDMVTDLRINDVWDVRDFLILLGNEVSLEVASTWLLPGLRTIDISGNFDTSTLAKVIELRYHSKSCLSTEAPTQFERIILDAPLGFGRCGYNFRRMEKVLGAGVIRWRTLVQTGW